MSLSFVQTVLFLLFLTFHSLADDPSSGSAGTDTASFPTFPPADGFLGSSASISGLTTDGANNDQRGQVFDPLNDGEILASKIDACPDTQIPHSKRQNCRYIAPEGTNTPDTNGDEGGSNPVGKPSGEPDPLIPLQIPQLQDFKEDRSRCNHGLTKIPVCATSSNAIYSTPLYQGTSFFNLPTCHLYNPSTGCMVREELWCCVFVSLSFTRDPDPTVIPNLNNIYTYAGFHCVLQTYLHYLPGS